MSKEKRVLKHMFNRMPKKMITTLDLAKIVSKKENYSYRTIQPLVSSVIDTIIEEIIAGNSVKLKNLATLFPTVKPSKNVVNMGAVNGKNDGDRIMKMDARWVLKMRISEPMKASLLAKEVTKEDEENLYRN